MKFIINIECNNDAFNDDANYEVSRILNNLANVIKEGSSFSWIKDINGNTCGFASFEDN
jgi:hypothetical protein